MSLRRPWEGKGRREGPGKQEFVGDPIDAGDLVLRQARAALSSSCVKGLHNHMSFLVPFQVLSFTATLASFMIGRSLCFSFCSLDALAYALQKHSAFSLSEAVSRAEAGNPEPLIV